MKDKMDKLATELEAWGFEFTKSNKISAGFKMPESIEILDDNGKKQTLKRKKK